MRRVPLLPLLLAGVITASCATKRPPEAATPAVPLVDARERVLRSFNAAFNAQDAGAMAALVTPDVQWLSVKGQAVTLETRSREELRRSMAGYFKTCPTCRSKIANVIVAKTRVSVLEVASWTTPQGARETQGFVVYEFAAPVFAAPLISRVYYFPEEK